MKLTEVLHLTRLKLTRTCRSGGFFFFFCVGKKDRGLITSYAQPETRRSSYHSLRSWRDCLRTVLAVRGMDSFSRLHRQNFAFARNTASLARYSYHKKLLNWDYKSSNSCSNAAENKKLQIEQWFNAISIMERLWVPTVME